MVEAIEKLRAARAEYLAAKAQFESWGVVLDENDPMTSLERLATEELYRAKKREQQRMQRAADAMVAAAFELAESYETD